MINSFSQIPLVYFVFIGASVYFSDNAFENLKNNASEYCTNQWFYFKTNKNRSNVEWLKNFHWACINMPVGLQQIITTLLFYWQGLLKCYLCLESLYSQLIVGYINVEAGLKVSFC